MLTAYSLLSIFIIVADEDRLNKPEFKKKYGSMYLNLDYKYRINRTFNFVYMFRRILIAVYATQL